MSPDLANLDLGGPNIILAVYDMVGDTWLDDTAIADLNELEKLFWIDAAADNANFRNAVPALANWGPSVRDKRDNVAAIYAVNVLDAAYLCPKVNIDVTVICFSQDAIFDSTGAEIWDGEGTQGTKIDINDVFEVKAGDGSDFDTKWAAEKYKLLGGGAIVPVGPWSGEAVQFKVGVEVTCPAPSDADLLFVNKRSVFDANGDLLTPQNPGVILIERGDCVCEE